MKRRSPAMPDIKMLYPGAIATVPLKYLTDVVKDTKAFQPRPEDLRSGKLPVHEYYEQLRAICRKIYSITAVKIATLRELQETLNPYLLERTAPTIDAFAELTEIANRHNHPVDYGVIFAREVIGQRSKGNYALTVGTYTDDHFAETSLTGKRVANYLVAIRKSKAFRFLNNIEGSNGETYGKPATDD